MPAWGTAAAEAVDAQSVNPADPAPSPADMAALAAQLAKAERPLMIVGGPGWSRETQAAIETFAARFDLPVAAAFRYQDYIDNRRMPSVHLLNRGDLLVDSLKVAHYVLVIPSLYGFFCL